MEKKKLLLVAISVGVFLVITIVTAIYLLPPVNAVASSDMLAADINSVTQPPVFQNTGGLPIAPVDPVNLVRRPEEVPGLQSAPDGAVETRGSLHLAADQSRPGETVISVRQPGTVAVPDAAPTPRPTPTQPAPRPAPGPAPAATTPAAAPAAPAAPAATPPASRPAAPAAQTRVHTDYWIQAGAFATVGSAERVRQTLATSGITSIIENREINGRDIFRVRIGPYTSQNEANYWLTLVRGINGFEDSQVRVTQSSR